MIRTMGLGIAFAAAALLLVGCAAEPGTVRVTGRLIDAETGEPVSRDRIFVHAFNDATEHQVSLKPNSETTFELEMPAPEIRLRIPDLQHAYELFEEDFVAKDGRLEVDVRLQPTHWIQLHGTVLWKDKDGSLRPLNEGDGNVRKASLSGGRYVGFGTDATGRFATRAPRELIEVLSINTSYQHEPREVDLSDVEADEFEVHFVLTQSR